MEVRNVIFRTILQKLRWPNASFPDICVYPIVRHWINHVTTCLPKIVT